MADTDIRALVESKATDLEGLLSGSGLTVERFKSTVFQLWEKDSELRKCTPDSILSGILQIADLGLTLSPALGHAYLVKYGDSATPQTGYKGLMYLALQSGGALDFRPGVRHQADHWRHRPLHPTEPIEHEPADGNRGPVIGYYAVVFLPGGLARSAYMTKAEVEAHRDKYSKAYKKTGKWGFGSFDDMALKTVVRQACKFIRLTGKLEKASSLGSMVDLDTGEVIELPPDNLPTVSANEAGKSRQAINDARVSLAAENNSPAAPPRQADKPATTATQRNPPPPATVAPADTDMLYDLWKQKGNKMSALSSFLMENFQIEDAEELQPDQMVECIRLING